MRDLTSLMKRSAKGDEGAFSCFVKETEGTVYRYLLAILKNREDALDISQETYLKLWRTLSSYRGDCSPTAWLLRIARSCAIDHLRKEGKHEIIPLTFEGKDGEEHTIEPPDPNSEARPDEAFAKKEMRAAVRQAILSLDDDRRDVLVLREFEGLSYEEIAHRLSLEVGTVKSRLNRARQAVKDFLISRNFF